MRKWIDLIRESNEMVTLYHGTCPNNATRLLRDGWAPNQVSPEGNMGQTRYLYLSTGQEDAEWFANEKGCDTVLAVHCPKSFLQVDPEDGTYDTVDEEMNSSMGLPGKLVLTRPLDASHFSVVKGTINEAMNEEPEYGPGELCTAATIPSVLYHGTNPIAAAMIFAGGAIEAQEMDEQDLGEVVCTTSDAKVGRDFAIEYVRANSDYDVGFVFEINGKALAQMQDVYPYHAETAGVFEYEYRVCGDIPMSLVTAIRLVGDRELLTIEQYVENLWRALPYHRLSMSLSKFHQVMEALVKASS